MSAYANRIPSADSITMPRLLVRRRALFARDSALDSFVTSRIILLSEVAEHTLKSASSQLTQV